MASSVKPTSVGDHKYWHDRWLNGETAWKNDEEKNREHEQWFNRLSESKWIPDNASFFVPLCGDSPIVPFLVSRSHKVLAVEFSKPPVLTQIEHLGGPDKFENIVVVPSADGTEQPVYERYHGKDDFAIIDRGDFFMFKAPFLVDCVWDRASLVAIEPARRAEYVRVMHSVLKENGVVFLAVFERDDQKGPPFNVSRADIKALYEDTVVDGFKFRVEEDRTESGVPENIPNAMKVQYVLRKVNQLLEPHQQPLRKAAPNHPMPGSYRDAHVDEKVQQAADFAVQHINGLGDAKFELAQIVSASKQVVAGMNYKLVLSLRRGDTSAVETHKVTVYDRFGQMSVTAHAVAADADPAAAAPS